MANYLPNGSVYTGDTHYTSGVLMTGAVHSADSQTLTTTEDSQTNPQITDGKTPLRTLSMQALRRFGDFNATTVDGDVLLMFIEFANMIIDDIRMHPYAPRTTYSTTSGDDTTTSTSIDPLTYYKSIDESRNIDDQIVVAVAVRLRTDSTRAIFVGAPAPPADADAESQRADVPKCVTRWRAASRQTPEVEQGSPGQRQQDHE